MTNSRETSMLKEITYSIETCQKFYINVAFVSYSGLQLLLDSLRESERRQVKGKILTGTYLNFTDSQSLRKLTEFTNLDVRLFIASANKGFHPKAYIFEYTDYYKVIIGSSNITQYALKSNVEWNVKIITKNEDKSEGQVFIAQLVNAFNELWETSEPTDEHLLKAYEAFKAEKREDRLEDPHSHVTFQYTKLPKIIPNSMQQEAIEELEWLRSNQQKRALVIAATGTGKTYLAAFDAKQVNPKKLLFLVHRENILKAAQQSFEEVLSFKYRKTGIFSGNQKDREATYLFATLQMMANHLNEFERDEFEYIIIDEAHHVMSPSYQKITDYFTPRFMLGMTATPERTDGGNIFDVFDQNIATEIRLREALEADLLVPFHYFGIADINNVDLTDVDIQNIDLVAQRLMIHKRVEFIIEKMNEYSQDGLYRKGLGFCATIEHAQYMTKEFNRRGIPSVCLTGEDSIDHREKMMRDLESDRDSLEMIFTVDIFNEGIDIPSVNLILMLRPTQSPIIFTQQLGRGLRKKETKEFLTVLDFIGNHQKAYLLAIALHGSKFYDKDSLKVAVKEDFPDTPGASNIRMDKISKEIILDKLESENFYSMKYLRTAYEEFKQLLGGEIVWNLQAYLMVEQAPDPLDFLTKSSNYIRFLEKVEKQDPGVLEQISDPSWMALLDYVSNYLPLKRLHEFVLLKLVKENSVVSVHELTQEMKRHSENVDKKTIIHAIENIAFYYADKGEQKRGPILIEWKPSEEKVYASKLFLEILKIEKHAKILADLLNYGIHRYEKEFGHHYYGIPHFKLYEEYSMRDTALLSNYTKTFSSFRGSGVLRNKETNDYFLFIDLHKDEGIESRLNYQDKFLSRKIFQWESPNNMKVTSERGQDLVFPEKEKATIHLFVRKFRKIDGVISKFIYIGKGNPIAHENEKPIQIHYQLEQKLPAHIAEEFEISQEIFV